MQLLINQHFELDYSLSCSYFETEMKLVHVQDFSSKPPQLTTNCCYDILENRFPLYTNSNLISNIF